MKACDYCGRGNEDALTFCAECGSILQPPIIPPEPPIAVELPPVFDPLVPPLLPVPPPGPRVLNGGMATAVLGIYLGAQSVAGFVGGLFGGLMTGIRNEPDAQHHFTNAMREIMPLAVFLTMLFGGIAIVSSALGFKFQLNDTSPTGAAWVRGSWGDIAIGLAIGVLVALLWLVALNFWGRYPTRDELGRLTRMSVSPGLPQIAWVMAALLLAPPFEELLFRGILYGGYRKSLGAAAAAAITTLIFAALHLTELIYQPLATFAIASVALAALRQRLRGNAIGPAIAVHFGYNATVVFTALCLM